MRIVSLLPSLTELIGALGRAGDLVGVTHECDHPAAVGSLPRLTRSRIDPAATSAEIDAAVSAQGGSLYVLDERLLTELRPDLILTQSQCDVCAVAEGTVREAAARLPGNPRVESVNPTDLAGVWAVFRRVGDLLGAHVAAEGLIDGFAETAATIADRRRGLDPLPTVLLEWADPPYGSGHWNPEIVALAGGVEMLGRTGQAARRIGWDEVAAAAPEALIVAPCGYALDTVEAEIPGLARRPEWSGLPATRRGQVVVADGNAYFSRPGPRLEASLRIAAAAIDPGRCGDLAPPSGWRRLIVTS